MVLHSSSICLLEQAFLFNMRMPRMWEGERPLGDEVWVLSGLRHALLGAEGGLVSNGSPSPEARHCRYFPALLWAQIFTRSLL